MTKIEDRYISLISDFGKLIMVAGVASLVAGNAAAQPVVSIATFDGDRKASVSLTFDDGTQDHYTHIAPQLNKWGLCGTFGINGGCIGDVNNDYAPRLTWEQVKEMDEQGHEINNHTWSHFNLYDQPELAQEEFEKNDSAMIVHLGHPAKSAILPFNAYTPEVLEYIDSTYVGVRLTQFALGQHDSHATRESINRWLEGVVKNGEWGVTMTHGIFRTWDYWHEPQVLWDFFAQLGAMKDTVWVDTFEAVQCYIKERDASTVATENLPNGVKVEVSCPLPQRLYNQPLTLKLEFMPEAQNIDVTQGGAKLPFTQHDDCLLVNVSPHGGDILVTWN